ncbi:MAG: hypothetical protein ABI480_16010 [Chitinophagaceae bacterium]
MKKILAVLFLAVTFAACNNEGEKTPEIGKDSSDTPPPETPQSRAMTNKDSSSHAGGDSTLHMTGDTMHNHH